MILDIRKFLFSFLIFFLLVLLIHVALLWAFPGFINCPINQVLIIYFFLFCLNAAHFMGLRWIIKKWPKFAGLLFTALSLVKMLFSILFLLPFIFPNHEGAMPLALNFMAAYLFLLGFEVIFLAKNMINNH